VQERHAACPDTGPRLFVDQPQAGGADGLERPLDVVGPIGDVVKAGAAPCEEAAHGGVRAEWAQQLDVAVAHAEENRLDALRLDRLTVLKLHPEPVAVERDGVVEILNRDSDVVDPPEHGR